MHPTGMLSYVQIKTEMSRLMGRQDKPIEKRVSCLPGTLYRPMNLTKTLTTSETCSSISIPYFDGTVIHHSSCEKTASSFYCGGDLYHTAVNVTFSLSVGQSVLLAASRQFFQIQKLHTKRYTCAHEVDDIEKITALI